MEKNPLPWQAEGLRRLVGGPRVVTRLLFRHMHSSRRCKVCWVPLRGLLSAPFQIIRIRPSRKNPDLCTM